MFRGAEDKRTGVRTSATQIEISRMDKEPNFVSYEAKLAPPRAPVELREDTSKPQNKAFSTLT